MQKQKVIILFVCFGILLVPASFVLADSEGQNKLFFVDSSFDVQQREKVSAILQKSSEHGYFYVETDWYNALTDEEKQQVIQNLGAVAEELDKTIYPQLTNIYGKEWTPGIDNDAHITVLFHQLKEGAAGYFRGEDEYYRLQSETSNEREMVYLSTDSLKTSLLKSYLAHEITHLITFNQKDRLRGLTEETWLNELRAEYAPTILGYDANYQGSYLQKRVKIFLESPSNSLTEWKGQKEDYGVISLLAQYIASHYGRNVLTESITAPEIGISSIDRVLTRSNIPKSFSAMFSDWAIATFLNDCEVSGLYCYKNENLKNLRITPSLIFLPSAQKTEFSLNYSTVSWAANWYRIISGEGKLNIVFQGDKTAKFTVPYVLCKESGACEVDFLELNEEQKGELNFENFGEEWASLTLIPLEMSKTTNFDGKEPSYNFSIFAKAQPSKQANNPDIFVQKEEIKAAMKEVIRQLIVLINQLIIKLQDQLNTLLLQ